MHVVAPPSGLGPNLRGTIVLYIQPTQCASVSVHPTAEGNQLECALVELYANLPSKEVKSACSKWMQ